MIIDMYILEWIPLQYSLFYRTFVITSYITYILSTRMTLFVLCMYIHNIYYGGEIGIYNHELTIPPL